jgi:hypothetical protein
MKYANLDEMIHDLAWKRPDSYVGPNHFEYLVLAGQNRDSDSLTRSNFIEFLALLGGESEENGIQVIRDSHWAVGWIEMLMIHRDAPHELLEKAMKALNDLDAYPVLNDEAFSELEHAEAEEVISSNLNEFRRELLEFIGFKNPRLTPRGARAETIDLIVSRIYHAACGYSGPENAWVNSKSIAHYLRSDGKWDIWEQNKGNLLVKAIINSLQIPNPKEESK